jgi:hypothetical protein
MPIEPRIVFALRAAADVDIHAIGLQVAKGDLILISFFENASRRFSDEFYRRRNCHAFADPGRRGGLLGLSRRPA